MARGVTRRAPSGLHHFAWNGDSTTYDALAKWVKDEVTDAAITSGSTTLTSATAGFTSAHVGRAVIVFGAGVGGAKLRTTISAYVSATSVTLAEAASTTVSGATLSWASSMWWHHDSHHLPF